VSVRANARLGIYAGPQVSQAEFRTQCAEAARKGRDAEIKEVEKSYQIKIERLEARIETESRELRQDETEHSQRKWEEVGSGAETLLSLFGGRRRRLSTALTKRRMTEQAKADVEESKDAIEDLKKQISELEQEKAQAIEVVNSKWSELADDAAEISVTPLKKDVLVDIFGVAWFPYYRAQVKDEVIELPAFGDA
jgi:DNA repair exonuclease SbcCD ATPase subunit